MSDWSTEARSTFGENGNSSGIEFVPQPTAEEEESLLLGAAKRAEGFKKVFHTRILFQFPEILVPSLGARMRGRAVVKKLTNPWERPQGPPSLIEWNNHFSVIYYLRVKTTLLRQARSFID